MKTALARFTSDYGMLFVLLLLCAAYSWATWEVQEPNGAWAGERLAEAILGRFGANARVAVVVGTGKDDAAFARGLAARLRQGGAKAVTVAVGRPEVARRALEEAVRSGQPPEVIACNAASASWLLIDERASQLPALTNVPVLAPAPYSWPSFLELSNLLNIANQIAVIAILAVGMTLVIITGGIDLSVGSLVGLSAVVTTLLLKEAAAEWGAGPAALVLGCLGGVAVCALAGCFSGWVVAWYGVPPFIATLAMMLVANGLAMLLSGSQSIAGLPGEFTWLGRGTDLLGVPNQVVLMAVLYLLAHVLMTRTAPGRYIYAVGGNVEAARLSGVPVRGVLLFVYAACGALAGLGGVVMASQLHSGSANYGLTYELAVIAAVVVGGASLQGGQGKVLGTLIGAFIIAVIQNGMNLTGVRSETQRIILGAVILGAVLLDRLKRRGLRGRL
jgi:ribose transport system permease protein